MKQQDQEIRTGVIAGILAYTMWGFFPLYFKEIDEVSSIEILAHRIIWAVPFGLLILHFRKQLSDVVAALKNKRTLTALILAAFVIALNWFVYVWAVQNERIFEASLGYYINPLVFVLVGVVVTKERLSRLQLIAVGTAALGVLILTIYGGVFPWVSITLAISFTMYGYIRRITDVGAMPGLFIETVVLLLPALAFWYWLAQSDQSGFFTVGGAMPLWLILVGPITVLPLLCFAIAARRLRLSTLGFLQYIGPTLQFLTGLYYGEVFTTAHAWCFSLIWIAVGTYSYDAWRKSRAVSQSV